MHSRTRFEWRSGTAPFTSDENRICTFQVDLTGYDHITKGVGFGTRTFVMVGSGLFLLAVLIGAVTFNRKAWICVELNRVPGTVPCILSTILAPCTPTHTTLKLSLNSFLSILRYPIIHRSTCGFSSLVQANQQFLPGGGDGKVHFV